MTCLPPPKEFADAKSIAELAEPLRSRVAQLCADAPTGGLVLVSGKRTDYQQWLLRHERCPGRECDAACKGHPTTARPGTSRHRNLGPTVCAADLGGRELDWANRVKRAYGLHTPVKGEPWHFEVVPGVTPTVPIALFPGGEPEPAPTARQRILRPGATGQDVAYAQVLLNQVNERWPLGNRRPLTADGDYGPATTARMKEFETWANGMARLAGNSTRLQQDGIATIPTQDALVYWARASRG